MTERIDHTNYEAWLLDRLEGNLSPEQQRALGAFLALHPELDPGTNELPGVRSIEAHLSQFDKEGLKRTLPPTLAVSERNVEDHLIARIEGDLDPLQLEALRMYLLEHPEHLRSERLYALTKSVPEALLYAPKKDIERHFPPQGRVTRNTLDDHLVAHLEGELSAAQADALLAYIEAHSEAQRSWMLMQATRIAKPRIQYPHKDALKKGGRVISIVRSTWVKLAAAATVALLLGIGAWLLRAPSVEAPDMVEVTPRTVPPAPAPDGNEAPGPSVSSDVGQPVQDGRTSPVSPKLAPKKELPPAAAPGLVPLPLEFEESLPIAQQVPTVLPEVGTPRPVDVIVPAVPPSSEETLAATSTTSSVTAPRTVGQLLAATVRERVLEEAEPASEPLDRDDAVAMVDRGLKAVAGDRTGLDVDRKPDGGVKGFNLRLGRNLAISASR